MRKMKKIYIYIYMNIYESGEDESADDEDENNIEDLFQLF